MVEAQVDPMEPPKHKHTKVPRGPSSPPAPVLHSPPRKLTVEDQQAWKIPSCVSNWKNARGYTIPLDKRLAADGRGLQEVTINNKFATLSESLYVAERKAAEGLRMRNQLRKKMAMQEKEDKERELREMANRARQERSGALHLQPEDVDGVRGRAASPSAAYYSSDDQGGSGDEEAERGHAGETEEERVARFQREKLRIQRRKERERELRIENMKGNFRKNKLDRDSERDVSEKIALGMHTGSGKLSGEAMYDSRLFNQSAGLDQGFGAEDEYNTYSKPLFEGRGETQSIYRPRQDDSDVYGSAEEQVSAAISFVLVEDIDILILQMYFIVVYVCPPACKAPGHEPLQGGQGL
jgi:SNW domain-containing protein 1